MRNIYKKRWVSKHILANLLVLIEAVDDHFSSWTSSTLPGSMGNVKTKCQEPLSMRLVFFNPFSTPLKPQVLRDQERTSEGSQNDSWYSNMFLFTAYSTFMLLPQDLQAKSIFFLPIP